MKRRPLPYVQRLTDHTGIRRHYYRHLDYRVTLPNPENPAFEVAYEAASKADPYPKILRAVPSQLERSTSVYILLNSGYVKIGIAANPKARLQDINIGSPVPAVIAATRIYSLRVHAREAELTLHRQFKDRHASGEWFAVPLEEAVAALLALPEAA